MDKLKDDSSKVGNIQTLLKYYKDKKSEIESVWKQDFSELKIMKVLVTRKRCCHTNCL